MRLTVCWHSSPTIAHYDPIARRGRTGRGIVEERMGNQNNSEIAIEFLRMAAGGAVGEAYARHVAEAFVHHNAWFPGDRESLRVAMEDSARNEPNKSFEIRQVISEGDRVVVFSHLQRAAVDLEYAVVHILRFDGAKIVEMWDIVQEVPKDSPNTLGMF
jgi:predicted SnoaL-like aldol condensation-catalyzing enzyme